MPSFAPGNRSRTASAMTCAVEWRIASSASWAPASRSSSAEPRSGASSRPRRRPRRGRDRRRRLPSRLPSSCLPRIATTSRPDRTRGRSTSRGSTRLHGRVLRRRRRSCARAALTGGSRAGSPAAHGWCLGRRPPGLAAWPRLSGGVPMGASRSTRCCAEALRPEMVGDTGLEPVTSCMSRLTHEDRPFPPGSLSIRAVSLVAGL